VGMGIACRRPTELTAIWDKRAQISPVNWACKNLKIREDNQGRGKRGCCLKSVWGDIISE